MLSFEYDGMLIPTVTQVVRVRDSASQSVCLSLDIIPLRV